MPICSLLTRLALEQEQPPFLSLYFALWISWERMRSPKLASQRAMLAAAAQAHRKAQHRLLSEAARCSSARVSCGLLLRGPQLSAQGAAAFARAVAAGWSACSLRKAPALLVATQTFSASAEVERGT